MSSLQYIFKSSIQTIFSVGYCVECRLCIIECQIYSIQKWIQFCFVCIKRCRLKPGSIECGYSHFTAVDCYQVAVSVLYDRLFTLAVNGQVCAPLLYPTFCPLLYGHNEISILNYNCTFLYRFPYPVWSFALKLTTKDNIRAETQQKQSGRDIKMLEMAFADEPLFLVDSIRFDSIISGKNYHCIRSAALAQF